MAAATTKKGESGGEIRAGTIYTLPKFMQDSGLGQAAMRTARRNGLKVRYVGRRGYVLGEDAIEYFKGIDN